MPEIGISVQNKIASVISGTPQIICGNSDYTLTFNFDEEFAAYAEKTLCIVYRRRGKMVKDEVLFTGDTVALPVLYETDMCAIGVYAGNLISSTCVMIPCVYCAETEHYDPPPDIYEQLLEYLAGLQGGSMTGQMTAILNGTPLSPVGIAEQI